MRKFLLILVLQGLVLSPVVAGPAITTAKISFRAGPGTGYKSIGTIPEGARIDLAECDGSGGWCAATYKGKTGFVSGKYVNEADSGRPGWPRSYTTDQGAEIVLYEPQVTIGRRASEKSCRRLRRGERKEKGSGIFVCDFCTQHLITI
jgi:uncharacterized protein YraI